MVMTMVSVSVVGAVIGSSSAMTSVDTVVGAKTARLLAEAIEDGRRLVRQRGGRQLHRDV